MQNDNFEMQMNHFVSAHLWEHQRETTPKNEGVKNCIKIKQIFAAQRLIANQRSGENNNIVAIQRERGDRGGWHDGEGVGSGWGATA